MKKILLLLFVFWSVTCAAQTDTLKIPALPVDSASHLITYIQVVEIPGAKQTDLYSKAREWFATNFKSAKSVLQMEDKEAGKLIGKGIYAYKNMLPISKKVAVPIDDNIGFTINISFKDGRYRVIVTDFTANSKAGDVAPLEQLYGNIKNNTVFTEKEQTLKDIHKMYIKLFTDIDRDVKNSLSTLRAALLSNKKDDF